MGFSLTPLSCSAPGPRCMGTPLHTPRHVPLVSHLLYITPPEQTAKTITCYNVTIITFCNKCNDEVNFCRAMLCISAAIAGTRCLSVCHVRELRQNE